MEWQGTHVHHGRLRVVHHAVVLQLVRVLHLHRVWLLQLVRVLELVCVRVWQRVPMQWHELHTLRRLHDGEVRHVPIPLSIEPLVLVLVRVLRHRRVGIAIHSRAVLGWSEHRGVLPNHLSLFREFLFWP